MFLTWNKKKEKEKMCSQYQVRIRSSLLSFVLYFPDQIFT
jgi:hypothetical protein